MMKRPQLNLWRSNRRRRQLISLILILGLCQSPQTWSKNIVLQSDLNLRLGRGTSQVSQVAVGQLKKGTVVSVPDEFLKPGPNGKIDLNWAVIQWLKKSQKSRADLPRFAQFNGDSRDWFFPVKVVKAAPGSSGLKDCSGKPDERGEYYIALDHLARQGQVMAVTHDTEALPRCQVESERPSLDPAPTAAPPPVQLYQAKTEAQGLCLGGCRKLNPVDQLRQQTRLMRDQVQKQYQINLNEKSDSKLALIERTFHQTCGFKLAEFIPILEKRTIEAGISPDVFERLLRQESMGSCTANNDGSKGLFQINTRDSTNLRNSCSANQLNEIKRVSILAPEKREAHLSKPSLRCVGNPLANLSEAIRIWKAKTDVLTNTSLLGQDGARRFKSFDRNHINREDLNWLTALAYNKGEGLPLTLLRNLNEYNRLHSSRLNPSSRSDLRLIAFDMMLKNASPGRLNIKVGLAFADHVAGQKSDAPLPVDPTLKMADLNQ